MDGLTSDELAVLRSLSSPQRVQDFLDTLAINHEKREETCMSPRRVLETRKAHCLEGALLAAVAFKLQGERPLLMELKATNEDQDHAVALYRVNGHWGAVSKTNHTSLRFRDPVYRTIRELALSYFHEYFVNATGKKTLRGFTQPFSLGRFGTKWITSDQDLWHIAYALQDAPETPIIPSGNHRHVRAADRMERRAGRLIEWRKADPRT